MRQPLLNAVLVAAAGALLAILPMAPSPAAAQEIMPTGTPTPATPTPTPTPPGFVKVNVPGSSTSASTNDGNVPANSVDGSLGTRWSGFGSGAWLQFDLGTTRLLKFVKVAAHMGNQRRNMFEVHTSADGTAWTVLMGGLTTTGTTTQLESFTLPGSPFARYVRYVGRGNSDPAKAGWNSVSEMEVWAYPNGPPAAPTNLRAQPDAGKVTLSWNAASASQFQIWRRLSQCDTYTQVGTSNATTFTDTNVVDRRHYYYYVVAVNSGGTSPPSDPIAVTPQIQPPPAPTLTAASGPADSGRVDLSWNAIPSATRYTIKRTTANIYCPPSSSTLFPIATVDAPATSYSDPTAVPGVTYYYAVSAMNVTGEGASSARVQVLALRSQAPTPPPTPTPCPTYTPAPSPVPPTRTPSAPIPGTVEEGIGRLKLTWSDTSGYPNYAKSYSLYRATAACGPFVHIARGITGYSYLDTGLVNDTSYQYFVVGINELGESEDSATLGGTPRNAPPRAPGRPSLDGPPSAGTVRLYWGGVFDADSYTVKRGTTRGGPYSPIATGIPPKPEGYAVTYADATVTAGTYYYVVAAVNAAGASPDSPELEAVVPGNVGTPTGLVASSGSGSIALSWNAVANASSYSVYRAASRCSVFSLIAGPSGTSFVDNVGGNQRYLYRVAATVGSVEGDPSSIVSAAPNPLVGTPTLSVANGPSLQLSWTPVSGANGYHIYRRPPFEISCLPVSNELLQTTGGSTTTFSDAVVTSGMTYQYVVQATVNGYALAPGSISQAGTVSGTNPWPSPTPYACPTGTPTPTPIPPSGPLTPPTGVTVTPGDRQASISWNGSAGAFSYRVYRSANSCGPFAWVGGRPYWDPKPFVDVNLINGATYYYIVTSLDMQAESPESPTVPVTPGARPPSSAPRNIYGVPGAGSAKIQWSPVYGATSYIVKRGAGSGDFTAVGTSTTDSFVDTGLSTVPYYYLIVPVNTAGEGPGGQMAGAVIPRSGGDVEITPPSSRVTASTNDGNLPGNTVDSNLNTRWSGYGGGAWVRFDLGATRTVTRVKVAVYRGDTRQNGFYIQTSPDNVNWTTRWAGSSSGTTTALQEYDITDAAARWVRYYGNGNINSTGADSAWNSVSEIEIFAVP